MTCPPAPARPRHPQGASRAQARRQLALQRAPALDVERLVDRLVADAHRLVRNEAALVPCAARCRRGEPIATSFVESAVDEIIVWRMAKKQQMRWSRATVQPFLDVRTAALNGSLEDTLRRRHLGFRPANDDRTQTAAVA